MSTNNKTQTTIYILFIGQIRIYNTFIREEKKAFLVAYSLCDEYFPTTTFRKHSGNIQGTFREHLGNNQGAIREQSGNIQATFSKPSADIDR
jgi:hypothetical protein